MCSSDFGLYDFLFERDDICNRADEDSLRHTLFASNDQTPVLKQESSDEDLKVVNDSEADDLWRSFLENDLPLKDIPCGGVGTCPTGGGQDEDFDSLRDLVGFPFDAVIDRLDSDIVDSAASDSGVSTDTGGDQQFCSELQSPEQRNGESFQASPESRGFASPDTLDAESDTSSLSEQGSFASSPSEGNGRIPSYQFELISSAESKGEVKSSPFLESPNSHTPIIKFAQSEAPSNNKIKLELNSKGSSPLRAVKRPQMTKLRLDLPQRSCQGSTGISESASGPSQTPVATTSAPGGLSTTTKTIFVTHPTKGGASLIRNGSTLLKTANVNGRSILLPVNVKDINQVKTIKIINAGTTAGSTANKNTVRTLFSTIQGSNATQSTHSGLRTLFTTTKTPDGRSLFKVTPTAMVTPNNVSNSSQLSPAITIKEECITSDDECPQNGQELVLTEEEKRLLKKEGIMLPPHYPLTKQEERDLKRIRRKIRNKISAQDSRKRKKEYVDGLEDRVKNCTEENHQLQKKIRHLETQNETLVSQLKRFHSLIGGAGATGRNQGHASTALMMLILSAALFVVPSLRSQQGSASDGEVSRSSSDLPPAGRSRSLLEAKVHLGMNSLDGGADEEISPDPDMTNPLSDHDYAPAAKKQKLYYPTILDDFSPQLDKTLPDSSGEPPDGIGGLTDISAMMGAFLDRLVANNWTDPGGQELLAKALDVVGKKRNRSLVLNLAPNGRIRDDIELE